MHYKIFQMKKVTIAAIQLEPKKGKFENNRKRAESFLKMAKIKFMNFKW